MASSRKILTSDDLSPDFFLCSGDKIITQFDPYNCWPITINAGPTSAVSDNAFGEAQLECGGTIHFHSSNGSIIDLVSVGSALVDLSTDADIIPFSATTIVIPSGIDVITDAITSLDFYLNEVSGQLTDVVVTDSDTIDLEIFTDGNGNFILSGDLILDPNPDNSLSAGPNGLFVSAPEMANFVVKSSDTIDLLLSADGSGEFCLSADLLIDPVSSNSLSAGPNGLFVNVPDVPNTTNISAIDTNTFDMSVSADGMGGFNVFGDIILDPVSSNLLSAGPDGLTLTLDCPLDCDGLPSAVSGNPIIEFCDLMESYLALDIDCTGLSSLSAT